ncbi:hypothetical protein, partial [Argonema galeatum]|uniref:hypothetical protein n=1 Tax=Argonema galeatum TaxID=2942762 RepID=UPI002012FB3C
ICVHQRSSVFISVKKLTTDENKEFDEIALTPTMSKDIIILTHRPPKKLTFLFLSAFISVHPSSSALKN